MYCSPDGGKWKMKLAPYVLFSDGRKAMFPPPAETVAREAEASDDVYAMYQGFEGSNIRAYTRISAEKISGDLRFEMRIEGDQPGEIAFAAYPSPWEAQDGSGLFTVLPRMQGELVPPGSALTVDKGKIFERTAYMPMFGQTAEGHACLAVYDTPCDASYDFALGRVTPLWRPSLGTVRYQRRMLYSFMQGDYNDIALRYRRYVKEKGNLITLKAKAALNPRRQSHMPSHTRMFRMPFWAISSRMNSLSLPTGSLATTKAAFCAAAKARRPVPLPTSSTVFPARSQISYRRSGFQP